MATEVWKVISVSVSPQSVCLSLFSCLPVRLSFTCLCPPVSVSPVCQPVCIACLPVRLCFTFLSDSVSPVCQPVSVSRVSFYLSQVHLSLPFCLSFTCLSQIHLPACLFLFHPSPSVCLILPCLPAGVCFSCLCQPVCCNVTCL